MYFEVYNKHRNSTEAGKLEVVSFIYRESILLNCRLREVTEYTVNFRVSNH